MPIRKKGKLPYDTIEESYELEYGKATIEIHSDALNSNDVNLICGMVPSLIAFNSIKPYFIMPHGSDVRLALGYTRKTQRGIFKRFFTSNQSSYTEL